MTNDIDLHVGKRLRRRRRLLGLTQQQLAESVGIRFQQIQKYERGLNRIGASRLYEFSRILGVPVAYFFEEFMDESQDSTSKSGSTVLGLSENDAVFEYEKLGNKEVLALVRSYYEIEDPLVRKRVLSLIKSLASPSASGSAESANTDKTKLQKA